MIRSVISDFARRGTLAASDGVTDFSFDLSGGSDRPVVTAIVGIVALALWLYYRRESRRVDGVSRWLLPLLRILALLLFALLWLRPAIEVRRSQPVSERVLLVVDRSASFARADPDMELSRAVPLAIELELLPDGFEVEAARASADDPTTADARLWRRARAELGELSRWERTLRQLLGDGSETALVEELRSAGDSVRLAFAGRDLELRELAMFRQGGFQELDVEPDVPFTDLTTPLEEIARGAAGEDVSVGIVVSDGRANRDASQAIRAARQLGAASVRLHTVGVGSAAEPFDLGIVSLSLPRSLTVEDATEGTIVLKTQRAAGRKVRVSLAVAEPPSAGNEDVGASRRELWSQSVVVDESARDGFVDVPFVLPPGTLPVGRRELVANVERLSGEATLENNERRLLVDARKRELWVLLVAGRARWEERYLKNLFSRDTETELNVVFVDWLEGGPQLPRGDSAGSFPLSEDMLGRFDVVFLNDVEATLFREEELAWLRRFVDERGGGLIFSASRLDRLASYVGTELEPTFPARPRSDGDTPIEPTFPARLELTDAGRVTPWLRLVPDEDVSAEMWTLLRPLTWVQPSRGLAGAEVLVRTQADGLPVLVTRAYGRGRVLYVATDETWRWRYKVGDRYHHRVWGQVVEALRGRVFAAEAGGLALDTDAATYEPDESIRVRLRWRGDADAAPQADALRLRVRQGEDPDAPIVREGGVTRESEGAAAIYVRDLVGLPAGRYTIQATVGGGAPIVALPILVQSPGRGEDVHFSWDESFLRELARQAGGTYRREEELAGLAAEIAAERREEVRILRYELWESWGWFAAIVAVLALEWFLRKRAGLL